MFKYTKDPIIFPRESSWFGQEIALKDRKMVNEGEEERTQVDEDGGLEGVIIPMEETQIFT